MELEGLVTAAERAKLQEYVDEYKLEIEINDDGQYLLLCVPEQMGESLDMHSIEPVGRINIKDALCRGAFLLFEDRPSEAEAKSSLLSLANVIRESLHYVESKIWELSGFPEAVVIKVEPIGDQGEEEREPKENMEGA